MTYKYPLLLCLLLLLGACSSMPSLIASASKDTPVEPAKRIDANEKLVDEESQALAENKTTLAESDLLYTMLSRPDLYLSSKRRLTPQLKTELANILAQFKRKEFDESEKAITKILNNEPYLNSGVYLLAGDIAMANDKPSMAIVHYQKALSLNEYNGKAANRLAMHMRQRGDFAKAEALYSQAIHAQASMAQSYRNRAILYDLYLNQKAKALADYQRYWALLDYTLRQQTTGAKSATKTQSVQSEKTEQIEQSEALLQASPIHNAKRLSDAQIKALKADLKLANRWLIDVGRQVEAIERAAAKSQTGAD